MRHAARENCQRCYGLGILPNDFRGPVPLCACGKPSVLESGDCAEDHGPFLCDCCIKEAPMKCEEPK